MVINPYIFKREPNTFIGGIAKLGGTGVNAPILTAAELADKMGIYESIIKGFKVVGEDVECRIISDYNTKIHSFGGTSKSSANQNITSFISNKLIDVGQGTFFNCDNIVEVSLSEARVIRNTSFSKCNKLITVDLPRVTTSYYGAFDQCRESLQSISLPSLEIAEASILFNFCTSLSYVDIKKCKKLGESVLNNNMLNNLANNPTINVNIYLRNVNDGEPDGDLLHAYTSRNATINFYDDNGNFVETYNP